MKRRLLVSSPLNAIVVTLTILALLLYCVRLISATGTTLGDPAAPMQPGTWAMLTTNCDALEHFPELGRLVGVNGNSNIYLYKPSTNQRTTPATNLALGGTWHTASYNPVSTVLVFCSAGTNALYKLSRSGQAPSTAPLFISPIGRKTWNRVAVKSGGLIQDQSKQVLSLIFSCQHSSPLLQEIEIAVRKKYSNWRYV